MKPHNMRCQQEKKKIGVLANINPIKRIHDAIEAFRMVQGSFPELHLEIAGSPVPTKMRYYEDLKRRILHLGLGNKIHFLGFVKDTTSWLRQLDLLLVPTETESAGLALIEAMTCGIPVVASDIPASREVAGDAAILVPVGDIEAFSKAIETLLSDEVAYRCVLGKGLQRSQEAFSVEALSEQYVSLYEETIGLKLLSKQRKCSSSN
jgi:glycosyltransferase involved in cell wall biosynthesis